MLARHDWFWFGFWLVKKLVREVLANHNRGIANWSYLHGQNGRLTVWANGKKNSGLVNFIPKLCLPFAQISSFYRKTAAKVWNRVSKMRFNEWNTNFRLDHPARNNTTTFSKCSAAPGNFPLEGLEKPCSIYSMDLLFHRISQRLLVNGKHPSWKELGTVLLTWSSMFKFVNWSSVVVLIDLTLLLSKI